MTAYPSTAVANICMNKMLPTAFSNHLPAPPVFMAWTRQFKDHLDETENIHEWMWLLMHVNAAYFHYQDPTHWKSQSTT